MSSQPGSNPQPPPASYPASGSAAPAARDGQAPAPNKPRKDKSILAFRRALSYLGPHSRLVIVSILCALLVGLTFTGGLGSMLPILKVLVDGDSVQNWINRQIVAKRLDVALADSTEQVKLVHLHHLGAAAKAGLHDDDQILLPESAQAIAADALIKNRYSTPVGRRVSRTLSALADPAVTRVALSVTGGPQNGGSVTVALPAVAWYLGAAYGISSHFPANPVGAIAIVLGFMLVLAVSGNFVRFFQEYLSDKAAILAVNDIRRQLYDHVLHIPLSFFGLRGTSDVTSRLVQDAQGLQDGFKTVLGQSIQEPIKAAMAFGLAMIIDWRLTLFIVLFGPLMFALIKKFGKKMRRASRKALQSSASMLGQLEATLIGIRVVKAGGAERFERRRYSGIMRGLMGEQLRMSRIDAMSTPMLETLTLGVICIIVLLAVYLVRIAHTLDPAKFMMLMGCLMAIAESLRRTSKVNNSLQKANAAAVRIFESLDIPIERRVSVRRKVRAQTTSSETAEPLVKLLSMQRDIAFENLSFTYQGAENPAIDGVNLSVPRGQCVAIVGRNGCGKTTLMSMLPRFFDPQVGRVMIDGIDIRRATLRSLRRQIGIVTQEAIIFPGTIAENIAYGHPMAASVSGKSPSAKALRVEIEASAKRAFAHEFILEKPDGYDTVLGEHGAQLSGGQRQRLCIARAILRRTPILILDEATSQVDAESEHLIQQAIEGLIHERTTFVIAHRFSTILSADRIVVMDRGRIVGQGSHDELLASCAVYQQLYDRQVFGGAGLAARENAAARALEPIGAKS